MNATQIVLEEDTFAKRSGLIDEPARALLSIMRVFRIARVAFVELFAGKSKVLGNGLRLGRRDTDDPFAATTVAATRTDEFFQFVRTSVSACIGF
jgi:hypothetical protein